MMWDALDEGRDPTDRPRDPTPRGGDRPRRTVGYPSSASKSVGERGVTSHDGLQEEGTAGMSSATVLDSIIEGVRADVAAREAREPC